MLDLSKVDTIIFDLGEVIVDLDPLAVIKELSIHADIDPALNMKEVIVNSPLLIQYETGKISEEVFLEGVNQLLKCNMTMPQFVKAWNLMLKDIPNRRLELMKTMGRSFHTMILSNTNGIHQRCFDRMVEKQTGLSGMHHFVATTYYSHDIGERKPDEACYRYVLDQNNLIPERTVFLDDNPFNVAAAKQLGIMAVQVKYPDQIFEILGA